MANLEHREACQQLEEDWRADSDNREDALEDLRFKAGDQWDDTERNLREAEGRPCLTINQMPQFVNQVAGDIRQAQPGIEVFPVDSADDVPLAKVYEGLIRQIEYQSNATSAYAHGVESAISCGIGHWRIETDYTTDSVFEQDICIKRILDPLSVIWDAGAVEMDRADAMHCYITDWVHKDEFRRRFKEADREGVDISIDNDRGTSGLYWRRDDFIRIAEYWYLKEVRRLIVMTDEGRTLDITDWQPEQQAALAGMVMDARTVDGYAVKRRMMDGQGWLGDDEDWAGRFIPIIPCLGAEVAFDGKVIRHGLIRFAKDPQKLYNYWRSASAEAIAKSPKAPWTVTTSMIKGLEGYWSNANRTNLPFLPYNVDPDAPTLRPERQQPPQVPAAFWQESGIARDDMKATTGIFDASLGAQGNETSGRAILARQREGDVGSFLYTDNFRAAMQRTGKVLIDLIPKIYDTQRQVRVLDVTGEEQFVPVNTQVMGVDGVPMLYNDLSHGRFDVRVKVGASYTTARVEAREQMAEAMQNNPQLWGVIGDLYFKNSDYPGSDEIAERLKRAVDPRLLGEDAEPQEIDPAQQMAMELEMADKQASLAEKQAKVRLIEAQIAKEMAGEAQPPEQVDLERRALELSKMQAEIQAIVDKQQNEAAKVAIDREKLAIEREKIAAGLVEKQVGDMPDIDRVWVENGLDPTPSFNAIRKEVSGIREAFMGISKALDPKPMVDAVRTETRIGQEAIRNEIGEMREDFGEIADALTRPKQVVLTRDENERLTGGRLVTS